MVRVLVVEPSPTDPLGPLGTWLTDAGADLVVVRPQAGDPVPSSLDDVDGLVVLGGEMDADDDVHHPFLRPLRALLGAAVKEDVPTLAVCLGAQLLALATGGSTRVNPDGPEAGPCQIALEEAADADPLFAGVPPQPWVLQFHRDEVERLPRGAQLLASSPRCATQAFRVGARAWGWQFHVETTPAVVRAWAEASPSTASAADPARMEDAPLHEAHAAAAEVWRPAVARFVALAAVT